MSAPDDTRRTLADAALARAACATPAPWRVDDGEVIAADEPDVPSGYSARVVIVDRGDAADLDFIAHAREDVPALAAEVLRLRDATYRASPRFSPHWRCTACGEWLEDAEGDDLAAWRWTGEVYQHTHTESAQAGATDAELVTVPRLRAECADLRGVCDDLHVDAVRANDAINDLRARLEKAENGCDGPRDGGGAP